MCSQGPVAGTSRGATMETTNVGGRREESVTGSSRPRGQGQGRGHVDLLSKAQLNVVRTMIYITGCFVLCWMPIYFYILFARFNVSPIGLYTLGRKFNPINQGRSKGARGAPPPVRGLVPHYDRQTRPGDWPFGDSCPSS